ncbi:ester cyclase [Streptomyces sp. NPDC096152]|uniref:ester cyclase n=1 Tax=Streptomyces sp. NPDC096152 TaxID=3366078 RepID=UPI00382B5A6D
MTHAVRAIARRMYDAFNSRDPAAAETIFSGDFVSHPLGTIGVDSVVKAWNGLHAAFPDIQVTVEDMLVDTDRAAVQGEGCPSASAGIPCRGERSSMMEIFRVQDGRIAELWGMSTLNRSADGSATSG